MTDSSTSQDTGITEAQAAETLFARYQSQDQGEGETGEESPPEDDAEPLEDDADPEEQSDADPEETEGDDEAPQTFKVKVHGEEIDVPLDELLKGYSREQDYTRKTQALSEKAKEAEAAARAAADVRDQYSKNLEAVSQIIEQTQPKVDQSLRQSNPAEWSAQMLQHRQWSEQKAVVEAERERVARQAAEQAEAEHAAFVRENREKLPELIPEWRDAKVAEAESARLYQYGIERGFSPDEMGNLADARAVALLRESMLYRDLMAKKPEVQNKLQAVKTLKPGSPAPNRGQEERRARERLANDGSTDAAARLILMKSRRA